MKTHVLNDSVTIFNHTDYGQRLLFTHGETNPRDLLGKIGVSFHSKFGSIFHPTIQVSAEVITKTGKQNQTFNINRKSLIKYLGDDAKTSDSDDQLINLLNNKLSIKNNFQEKEDIQLNEKPGLRHAGHHNQRSINKLGDSTRGSILSWFYQKTIASLNWLKFRFLLLHKEKSLFHASEILATKRFHEANHDVPAYQKHIKNNLKLAPNTNIRFSDIPKITKENYIKHQKYDTDTHHNGKYPPIHKTDTSTGTTGKPTEWIRGKKELTVVKKTLALAAHIQFGNRHLSYINAFALGPWATGLTSYEFMRKTGSVFATGADKDKILDKLINITKNEKHQTKRAVDHFLLTHPQIKKQYRNDIINILELTLTKMLKNSHAKLDDVLKLSIENAVFESATIMKQHYPTLLSITKKLNEQKSQIVITGYPPFLKDLCTYAEKKGCDFKKFSVVGVVGGQAISEAMRDQLIKHGFLQIYSSYGASDLDINLGMETEDEILVRKELEKNPAFAQELYGKNKGLPMVFNFDPMNYNIECDDENNLLFTCTREDRSSPRVRYDLGDKGRVYASSDVQALLQKHGIFHHPKTNLPLLFIWGRDSTVIFHGANLDFTELERAVSDIDELESSVLKKAFYTYPTKEGSDQIEIWLELDDNIELPNQENMTLYAHKLLNKLVNLNQDFRNQVEKLDDGSALPIVRFFKRGTSPISESNGHRKQVLIFQKGVNLDKKYEFPDEKNCCAVSIPKTSNVVNIETSNTSDNVIYFN